MRKYRNGEVTLWKRKANVLFVVLALLMIGVYISTWFALDDKIHSAIEGIAVVFADFICYYVFTKLYFAGIKSFVDNPGTKIVSEQAMRMTKLTLRFTNALNVMVWIVGAVGIILVVFKGDDREVFELSSLVLQVSYFMVLMAYKGYFIDLIVAFGEKTYISGNYTVAYDKIDKIVETRRIPNYLDDVVGFEVFYQGDKVGKDRWTDTDYRYLCERVGTFGS